MANNDDSRKKCGFCGENIPMGTRRCPYCGSVLEISFDDSYRFDPVADQSKPAADTGADESGTAPTEQIVNPYINGEEQQNQEQQENIQSRGTDEQKDPLQNEYRNPQGMPASQPDPAKRMSGDERPYYQSRYSPEPKYERAPLSNGLKVFLTILFTIIPGIGQLAGIITAIVFMSADGDKDRKSFGVAILVASLIMFVLACIGCFVFSIAAESLPF